MHKIIRMLAATLVVGGSALTHAATINFDQPSQIDIDNATNQAVYHEGGAALTGTAGGFLTIDGIGSGMTGGLALFSGNTLSLKADNGGMFSFLGLDAGVPYYSDSAGSLTITGIFGNNVQKNAMFPLTDIATLPFTAWNGLTELRFSGTGDVVLDNVLVNVSPVPEPSTVTMLLLGLGSVAAARRAAKRRSRA